MKNHNSKYAVLTVWSNLDVTSVLVFDTYGEAVAEAASRVPHNSLDVSPMSVVGRLEATASYFVDSEPPMAVHAVPLHFESETFRR